MRRDGKTHLFQTNRQVRIIKSNAKKKEECCTGEKGGFQNTKRANNKEQTS
jgi:hypothetical protein